MPASRPASVLQRAIDLAAGLGVLLVVLCSKQTNAEQVSQRVATTPGAKSLIVPIPDECDHVGFRFQTSHSDFTSANSRRSNDLSLKRNLGLVLARLHGWNKIAFVDDDITLSKTDNIARLAGQLDAHQVAGMVVREHPDNSVVCHARRLAGMSQDVFITGAVLGVHCNSLPLSFFPDIYNEDWFFFAKEAAARRLPRVGEAVQLPYDPYATPDRARREEFGDLLAEGLYALFGDLHPSVPLDEQLRGATWNYWNRFIDARRDVISETHTALDRFANQDFANRVVCSALDSLAAAKNQLEGNITADICVRFIDAWREDLADWRKFSNSVNNVGSTSEAMDFLEVKTWIRAEFGSVTVTS